MEKRPHIITAFDQDLNELNEQVQKLGRLAVKQFNLSIDALATQHEKTLSKILDGDVKLELFEDAPKPDTPVYENEQAVEDEKYLKELKNKL